MLGLLISRVTRDLDKRVNMMTWRMRWAGVALASVLALGCDQQGQKPGGATTAPSGSAAAPKRMAAPVQVVKAVAEDVPQYIDEIGTCAAREFVQIRPQVAGRIMAIHFEDGAEVKKGDKLFTIDPRPYQAALDAATAGLAQAKANLSLAKVQAENAKAAIGAHAISQEELETRQNAVTVALAEISAREADIETAKINLEYCTIVSPIDGRTGQRLVDVGNVVKANDDNSLLTIQRMDPIYADFTTSERNLDEVRQKVAQGTLKTLVWSPQESEEKAREGKLTFLDNMVQSGTGTIKLRATMPNEDRAFWPGQFVRVRLVLDTLKGAVLIPARAEQIGQQGPFVYVVKPAEGGETIAELRPIEPGQRQGDMMVVSKGVSAGESVVLVGQMMIMPGGPVMVMPSAAPATMPAGK